MYAYNVYITKLVLHALLQIQNIYIDVNRLSKIKRYLSVKNFKWGYSS